MNENPRTIHQGNRFATGRMQFLCKLSLLLLFLVSYTRVSLGDEDSGWNPGNFIPHKPWQEADVVIPAYPEQGRLLEVQIGSANFPFRVYIDPDSLSVGGDGVVRYTLVIVSTSGVWNTTYEGLRCGKHEYRRYAYGASDQWQLLKNSPWQGFRSTGMDSYRNVLYRDYLCDATNTNLKVDEMLTRIRYSRGPAIEE